MNILQRGWIVHHRTAEIIPVTVYAMPESCGGAWVKRDSDGADDEAPHLPALEKLMHHQWHPHWRMLAIDAISEVPDGIHIHNTLRQHHGTTAQGQR